MADQERTITVLELLTELGADNLKFQVLSECLTGTQSALSKKRGGPGSRLSFGTSEDLGAVAVKRTREALIVWMDGDKLDAAWAKLKSREARNG